MNEIKKQVVSKEKLLEAGVYFGHKKETWNPKMRPYIAKIQKGIHIIDLEKTMRTIQFSYSYIRNMAQRGASFIFVGTRKQAKKTILENALRTNSFYVCERWLGGTLTNARTIFKRVRRMEHLEKLKESNYEGYTKKEGIMFQRELIKLQKNLQGIRNMRRKPNIMIISDPQTDLIAIKEAKKLGVKTIGIVDTNNDPTLVDIAIPANDDSIGAITLIITILADAISEAKGGAQLYAFQPNESIILPKKTREKINSFSKIRENKTFRNKKNVSYRDSNLRRKSDSLNESASQNINKKEKENKLSNPSQDIKTQESQDVKKQEKETNKKKDLEKENLSKLKIIELKQIAKNKKIVGYLKMKKSELIKALS